jgi:tryptophan-rich sensory protein
MILAVTALFYRIRKISGFLMIPYLGWVSFAVVLNGFIWWLNRGIPSAGPGIIT